LSSSSTRRTILLAAPRRFALSGTFPRNSVSSNAEVIGISSDSVESHRSFALRHDLSFPLLSDEGGNIRRQYGVPKTFGLFPGRVTYVIDKEGVVRHVFASQLSVERHVQEALMALRSDVSKAGD
jgi:thioredoxin-dependent peroxiredoxin